MQLAEFLSPDDLLIGIEIPDKTTLLRQLAARAASRAGLSEAAVYEAVAGREALGSTGVGSGIALPHARLHGLKKPYGLLARLRQPLPFDAIDEQPVDLVLLLLLPEANATQVLACAARSLRNVVIATGVRRAQSKSDIYAVISGAKS